MCHDLGLALCNKYPRDTANRITVAKLMERWAVDRDYLERLAIAQLLRPHMNGWPVWIDRKRPQGVFGFMVDVEESSTCAWQQGPGTTEVGDVRWFRELPDEADYWLPFVLDWEEQNPILMPAVELCRLHQETEAIVPGGEDRASGEAAASILPSAVGGRVPEVAKRAREDKAHCQEIARQLWLRHPEMPYDEMKQQPGIASYVRLYPGKHTVQGWLSEVAPEGARRRGRRRKTPV